MRRASPGALRRDLRGVPAMAGAPASPHCRCSTPTTRCGSGTGSRAAGSRGRAPTGAASPPGRPPSPPPPLALPSDRPGPAGQSFRGTVEVWRLGAGTARELRALAQGAGATLFMPLLPGFSVLLARHAGQDDVLVGTPVANRTRLATEG